MSKLTEMMESTNRMIEALDDLKSAEGCPECAEYRKNLEFVREVSSVLVAEYERLREELDRYKSDEALDSVLDGAIPGRLSQ